MILPQEQLRRQLARAWKLAYPQAAEMEITVELAADPKHGDYTSTLAMRAAKILQQPPTEVAQHLLSKLGTIPMLASAEVVGPGFINFILKPEWLRRQVAGVVTDRYFGRNNSGRNRRLVVEYISANPTGPLTLANGRGAFAGEAMCNVMARNGWQVTREYYLNDAGNQANILAESVIRRYFKLQGIPTEYPDYCYQGEYINDLAQKLKIDRMKLGNMMTLRDRIKGKVLEIMIAEIQRVVSKKLKVKFDRWQRESALYIAKLDKKGLMILKQHGLVYDQDGATWFRTTAYGDDKDRVLIKKDGEPTYLLSDVALRLLRFEIRKVDHEILYLGADHHGYIKRLEAVLAAIGQAGKIDVEIVQMVKLIRDGKEVRMSKRAGNYVPIEDVVDEVGLDVTRFFFLMHGPDTHMEFDLDLAKERSEKNPVFYVQYAHARIASIFRKAAKLPRINETESPAASELKLVKILLEYPGLIAEIGRSYETQKLPFYALDLARAFHDFYTHCRVIDQGRVVAMRLKILEATKKVLADVLAVMGVTAPDKM